MKIKPTPGFILILPETDEFFSIPESLGNVRSGKVSAVGSSIYHASGKEIPSPVKVGDTVFFQYVENHDIEVDGEKGYLVQFNLITGIYER